MPHVSAQTVLRWNAHFIAQVNEVVNCKRNNEIKILITIYKMKQFPTKKRLYSG